MYRTSNACVSPTICGLILATPPCLDPQKIGLICNPDNAPAAGEISPMTFDRPGIGNLLSPARRSGSLGGGRDPGLTTTTSRRGLGEPTVQTVRIRPAIALAA